MNYERVAAPCDGCYQLVEVRWTDITSVSHWAEREEVTNWQSFEFDVQMTTVGWLVDEGEHHVTIAACKSDDGKMFNLIQRFPRGCIRSITPIG